MTVAIVPSDEELFRIFSSTEGDQSSYAGWAMLWLTGYQAALDAQTDELVARALANVDTMILGSSGFADAIRESVRAVIEAARADA